MTRMRMTAVLATALALTGLIGACDKNEEPPAPAKPGRETLKELQQLALMCVQYSAEYGGKLPRSIQDLPARYGAHKIQPLSHYTYILDGCTTEHPDTTLRMSDIASPGKLVLLYEKPTSSASLVHVAYADGHVDSLNTSALRNVLRATAAQLKRAGFALAADVVSPKLK